MAKKKKKQQQANPLAKSGSPLAALLRPLVAAFHIPYKDANALAPAWRLLPVLLFVGFVLRAAVALAGDFSLHPDEIMQYLEPAHGLVFGNNIAYWEYYYGARSWLIPTLVALPLWLAAAFGADSPSVYVPLVKLFLAALSLLIPYGMYHTARHTLSETTARIALLIGVFWYEFIGFAHKAMSEFVATSLLCLLLAWVTHPRAATSARRCLLIVALAALVFAFRFQYATLLAFLAVAYLLRAYPHWKSILAAGAAALFAIGLFDYATWGQWFHSYWTNLQVNLVLGGLRQDESPWHIFFLWLFIASGGAFAIAAAACKNHKRRRFFIGLLLFLIIPHILQAHREYRFIFAALPLYLILVADFIATVKLPQGWQKMAIGGYLALVSALGIFNAIPFQHVAYRGFSQETGIVNFLGPHDPIFGIYKTLAADAEVQGVWDATRVYFNGGGYYYLHRPIPLYDIATGFSRPGFLEELDSKVTHIVAPAPVVPLGLAQGAGGRLAMKTADEIFIPLPAIINDSTLNKLVLWGSSGQATPIDGFVPYEKEDGSDSEIHLSIWQRSDNSGDITKWERYTIYPDNEPMRDLLVRAIGDHIRPSTPNAGIKPID